MPSRRLCLVLNWYNDARMDRMRSVEEAMPLIYRAMRADGDGPMVGHTDNDTLGVRLMEVRSNGQLVGDVQPVGGLVQPGTGGMSVSPSKAELPPHLIPKRFCSRGYARALRNNTRPDTFPWRMGDGNFLATNSSTDSPT
jgi:hypothetical protein